MPPRPLAFALTLLALALCPSIALADDGYLGVAGSSVVPLQNAQVCMDAEYVPAEIRGDEAGVTCMFTFTNGGLATNVLIRRAAGSPSAGRGSERSRRLNCRV